MDNFNLELLEAIRGAYSPGQMFAFVDASISELRVEELDANDNMIVFHEKFHHWQSIMTNYGQLKWAMNRTTCTEILKFWLECTNTTPHNRCMPISYLLTKDSESNLSTVTNIYFQMKMMELINLKERKKINPEILKIIDSAENFISPIILVAGKETELNGIDIIESFAKYQEAIFALIAYDIPFEATMDMSYLNQEYFIAYLYFVEQVGIKRCLEFPLICDLALTTKNLGFPKRERIWKDNHPAWRFIKLVNVLKNNPSIPYICFDDIKKSISNYINLVLKTCEFDSLDEIWTETIDYLQSVDLLMCKEMLRGIAFKKEHPWALAYPFIDKEICKRINDFHPIAYRFKNLTQYPVKEDKDELWGSEIVFENHLQAFVKQICGEVSKYTIYRDEILCGFAFFGLQGCPYSGKCTGSINPKDGLKQNIVIDPFKDIVDGCSFGLFLAGFGVSVEDIDMQDVRTPISFDLLSRIAKEHNNS